MPKSKSEYKRNEVVRCPNCSEMVAIHQENQKSRDAGFEEGARKQAEMDSDTIHKSNIKHYSVSGWKNIGKKRGYFDFFEKQIRKEVLDEVRKIVPEEGIEWMQE